MSVQFKLEEGNVCLLRASGELTKAELAQVQSECEAAISKVGHIKILVILKDFAGWERAKGWADMSFAEKNDAYIDKFAIVGDEEWRDLVYAFTAKDLRPVPIEYFEENQEKEAREWLEKV